MTSGTSDGPHYFGPMVSVDPTLTATSSQAWGFFFAATPAASVDLLFHHSDPMRPCTMLGDTAWTSPTAETIRAPVVAGYTTFVTLRCPPPGP